MKSIPNAHLTSRPTKGLLSARAEPKLTPWFPPDTKPAYTGVYQTSNYPTFQYWNGNYWCFIKRSVLAAYHSPWKSSFQHNKWRGLASNPAQATAQAAQGKTA